MNYTQNYQLPQWEKDDRIMMDDFNDAMGNIEEGLSETDRRIPQIVTGSYIGTGGEMDITLGFQPSAVLLFTCQGVTNYGIDTYGGLFTPELPLKCNSQTETAAIVTETGFKVYGVSVNSNGTSGKNSKFYYLAIKW